MKTWIRRTLITLAGVAVLGAGLAACGHRDHHGMGGPASVEDVAKWRGKFIDRAAKELVLDETQKNSLGLLFDKLNEQRVALMAGPAAPRELMGQLIAGERFDRTKAAALVDEKTSVVRSKSPEVIAAMADFYDGLKPEQQAKVRQFLARRGGHRGG
jgi:Spy/CpxP family protein refolding chaperone